MINCFISEKEASEKWIECSKRINYDNLYIIGSDHWIEKDEISRINAVPTKGTVIFTSKQYDDIEPAFSQKILESSRCRKICK